MGKTIEVETEDLGIVTVRKLALGDYAELLKSLRRIPADIMTMVQDKDAGKLKDISIEQLIEWVPKLMEVAPDEFIHLVTLSTDKTSDEVRSSLDLADAIDIFAAIMELNDYRRVIASIKKLQARMAANKNPQPTA